MKNTNFYVYMYLRDDNTPYYIGKGKGNRAWSKNKNEVKKPNDSTKIRIVAKDLYESESLLLEIKLIKLYGRIDLNTGILRNKTDGGDSRTWSLQQKQDLSNKLKLSWKNTSTLEKRLKTYSSKEFKEKVSQNTKKAWADPNSLIRSSHEKEYIVVTPNGVSMIVKNLKKFCEENGLDQGNMCSVANGNKTHHKSWKCLRVDNVS